MSAPIVSPTETTVPPPKKGLRVAIAGRYELLDIVGRGATATVWSAWDNHLKRVVALKLISRYGKAPDQAFFEHEAHLVSALEHPHIVPLYDYGTTTGSFYIVTRYLTGGTLGEKLQGGPLPIREALVCLSRVALALDYVHEQQVIHRDLKPGNILLDSQGMPYLADFGLAKADTKPDQEHSVSGTWNYMAPEQLVGRISAASDVFAFGVMAYQVVAGKLPFDGLQPLGMAMLTTGGGALPPLPVMAHVDSAFTAELNGLLQRLTLAEPADRPARLYPLLQHLENQLERRGLGATQTMPVVKTNGVDSVEDNADHAATVLTSIDSAPEPDQPSRTRTLSQTDFLIVGNYLQTHPQALSSDGATVLLETAIAFDRDVDHWALHWLRTSGSVPLPERLRLFARLVGRQLFHDVRATRALFVRIMIGSVLAFAIQIYAVITPNPLTNDTRVLNAAGNGLLFGVLIGLGVFAGIHLTRRLRFVPVWFAMGAGWLAAGVVIAIAFGLFQKLFYLDQLDSGVALLSALLFSSGFILSARSHPLIQFALGALGAAAGYGVPYLLYLNDQIDRPPFIFRSDDPTSGIALALVCALILSGFAAFASVRPLTVPFLARRRIGIKLA